MVQEGYVNRNHDTLKGIVVNDSNPDIRIEKSAYYAPDYVNPRSRGDLSGSTRQVSAR